MRLIVQLFKAHNQNMIQMAELPIAEYYDRKTEHTTDCRPSNTDIVRPMCHCIQWYYFVACNTTKPLHLSDYEQYKWFFIWLSKRWAGEKKLANAIWRYCCFEIFIVWFLRWCIKIQIIFQLSSDVMNPGGSTFSYTTYTYVTMAYIKIMKFIGPTKIFSQSKHWTIFITHRQINLGRACRQST